MADFSEPDRRCQVAVWGNRMYPLLLQAGHLEPEVSVPRRAVQAGTLEQVSCPSLDKPLHSSAAQLSALSYECPQLNPWEHIAMEHKLPFVLLRTPLQVERKPSAPIDNGWQGRESPRKDCSGICSTQAFRRSVRNGACASWKKPDKRSSAPASTISAEQP